MTGVDAAVIEKRDNVTFEKLDGNNVAFNQNDINADLQAPQFR